MSQVGNRKPWWSGKAGGRGAARWCQGLSLGGALAQHHINTSLPLKWQAGRDGWLIKLECGCITLSQSRVNVSLQTGKHSAQLRARHFVGTWSSSADPGPVRVVPVCRHTKSSHEHNGFSYPTLSQQIISWAPDLQYWARSSLVLKW